MAKKKLIYRPFECYLSLYLSVAKGITEQKFPNRTFDNSATIHNPRESIKIDLKCGYVADT